MLLIFILWHAESNEELELQYSREDSASIEPRV